jgi:hypothetical protein
MGGISIARIWAEVRPKLWPDNWAQSRVGTCRISTANGVLLAVYLVPAWMISALHIYNNPARGLFNAANIAFTSFAANYLHLAPEGLMRFALFVALVKITVVFFLACFVSLSVLGDETHGGDRDELLYIGLALASAVSVFSMLAAYRYGEAEAMKLHATETLMIVAAAVVAVIDVPRPQADIPVSVEPAEPLVQDNKGMSAAA